MAGGGRGFGPGLWVPRSWVPAEEVIEPCPVVGADGTGTSGSRTSPHRSRAVRTRSPGPRMGRWAAGFPSRHQRVPFGRAIAPAITPSRTVLSAKSDVGPLYGWCHNRGQRPKVRIVVSTGSDDHPASYRGYARRCGLRPRWGPPKNRSFSNLRPGGRDRGRTPPAARRL